MALSREQIVQQLQTMLGATQVSTDLEDLQLSSVDRFRRYEAYHDVFSMPLPAAVVKVNSTEDVAKVIEFANQNSVNVVPRTGRSATEGGLETALENSIVVDGSGMNKIVDIDITNMQVTAQCGVSLQVLDDQLRELGYTTGHSPQSKPLAQMGGLVATRSIGQFSTLYGGIEDMVVGLEAVFPEGGVTKIKNVPRRAAGPDIRHVIIGNEGALCFITEVTVKIFKYYPDNNRYLGYTLENMSTGFEILRQVMVEGYRPSVARVYDLEDGDYHFSHFAKDKCVLIFVTEGVKPIADATADAIQAIVAEHDECKQVDGSHIEKWFDHLNWDPESLAEEKREILEEKKICHTTEISANWSALNHIYETCMRRVREETPNLTMLGAHSSHSYLNGTNLYFVYFYDVSDVAPQDELDQCHLAIKKIIVEETINAGGSMCHHHGVGKHRTHWIEDEYGSSYYILKKLKQTFDPNQVMNMGTIIPLEK
jgi:alkyldihydroxyacetonephosphate synthase